MVCDYISLDKSWYQVNIFLTSSPQKKKQKTKKHVGTFNAFSRKTYVVVSH